MPPCILSIINMYNLLAFQSKKKRKRKGKREKKKKTKKKRQKKSLTNLREGIRNKIKCIYILAYIVIKAAKTLDTIKLIN